MEMFENPYQSPGDLSRGGNGVAASRERAWRSFRIAFLILLVPAIYNYWAFDTYVIAAIRLPGDLVNLYRLGNVLGFIMGGSLIWMLGLPVLELAARLIRAVLATGTDRGSWLEILYRSLSWIAILALPGAVLWGVWVFAFYQRQVDFYTISWAIGIPAHALAACLYLPLIYRWFRLALSAATC